MAEPVFGFWLTSVLAGKALQLSAGSAEHVRRRPTLYDDTVRFRSERVYEEGFRPSGASSWVSGLRLLLDTPPGSGRSCSRSRSTPTPPAKPERLMPARQAPAR